MTLCKDLFFSPIFYSFVLSKAFFVPIFVKQITKKFKKEKVSQVKDYKICVLCLCRVFFLITCILFFWKVKKRDSGYHVKYLFNLWGIRVLLFYKKLFVIHIFCMKKKSSENKKRENRIEKVK